MTTSLFGLPLLTMTVMTSLTFHFVWGQADWPDWCSWVPLNTQELVPECNGYLYPGSFSGFGCANWCQFVPDASWDNAYGCNECPGLYSGNQNSRALSQSGCQKGCQWVSPPFWKNTSDCNQCELPVVVSTKPMTKPMKTGLKVKMQAANEPDWCKWVPPSSLDYVAECKTLQTLNPNGCYGWCAWVPSTAWKLLPQCYLCEGQGPNVTTDQYTGCSHWCQWVPSRSWAETPECFQCTATWWRQPSGLNDSRTSVEILP